MKIIIFIVLVWISCASAKLDAMGYIKSIKANKLFIDTDVGSDDAVALFEAIAMSSALNRFEILGISCVGGNAKAQQVVINVLKVLKIANRSDIPVFMGSESPMLNPSQDGLFGKDGFGDVPFNNPPTLNESSPEHAVMAMLRLAEEHPKQITLVALGPLTNVALAVQLDPEFRNNLRHFIWMGSRFTDLENVERGNEFNAWTDPEANYVVFNSSGPPIIVAPWELNKVWSRIELSWRIKVLGKVGGVMDFLNAAEKKSFVEDIWSAPDSKAMSVALDPTVVTSAEAHCVVPVRRGGRARGRFIIDYKNSSNHTENAIYITGMNVNKFKLMLLKYLSAKSKKKI